MATYKSKEEIDGVFQAWPEAFKNRFGREITKQEIKEVINDLLHKKETQSITTIFSDWDVESLITALNRLNDHDLPNIKDEASDSNQNVPSNSNKITTVVG